MKLKTLNLFFVIYLFVVGCDNSKWGFPSECVLLKNRPFTLGQITIFDTKTDRNVDAIFNMSYFEYADDNCAFSATYDFDPPDGLPNRYGCDVVGIVEITDQFLRYNLSSANCFYVSGTNNPSEALLLTTIQGQFISTPILCDVNLSSNSVCYYAL